MAGGDEWSEERLRAVDEMLAAREAAPKAPSRSTQATAQAQRRAEARAQREAEAFWASPAGRARVAFDRGDQLFQLALDVMDQQAVVAVMVGAGTVNRTSDPTEILNSVCREGWDLVNGSFVFVRPPALLEKGTREHPDAK